jgi:hypothetical protein
LESTWRNVGVDPTQLLKKNHSAVNQILRETFDPQNTFESPEEVANWMEVESIYDNMGPWGIVERSEATSHPYHSMEYMSAMSAIAEKVNGQPCPLDKTYPTEAEIQQQLDDLLLGGLGQGQ